MSSLDDITNKKFSKSFRGYSPEEVDGFLDFIAIIFQEKIVENGHLWDQVKFLKQTLDEKEKKCSIVSQAIISAQNASESLKERSTMEAKLIKKEAILEAEKIKRESSSELSKTIREKDIIQTQLGVFKSKLRVLLESHLALLNEENLIDDTDFEPQVIKGNLEKDGDTDPVTAFKHYDMGKPNNDRFFYPSEMDDDNQG